MFEWFRRWKRKRRFNRIIKEYVELGSSVGDGLSYGYVGEPVGIVEDMKRLAKLEFTYVCEFGFQPISIDDFVLAGGYGRCIEDQLCVPWKDSERPVLPAAQWLTAYGCGCIHFGNIGSQLMREDGPTTMITSEDLDEKG